MNQAGLTAAPAAFLLDANQRLLGLCSGPGSLAEQALALFRALPAPERSESRPSTAPVLLMPHLLSPEMCTDLIDLWRTEGHEEGTVGSVLEGAEVERVYGDVKRRLDHRIMDPGLNRTLQQVLGRRIAPEVHKAFQFEGFRFDRFLVVCYDSARGDRFRPHRDNLSPETSDRRFAMTLNLNSSDYEGGELVFPEYGPHGYKPGNGGGGHFLLLSGPRGPSRDEGPALCPPHIFAVLAGKKLFVGRTLRHRDCGRSHACREFVGESPDD